MVPSVNSSASQAGLHLNILGSEFVVACGPAVTAEQCAELERAWSRCASPNPLGLGVPAEDGTDAQPYTASLSHLDGVSMGKHVHLEAGCFEELAEMITSYLTLRAIDAQAGMLTMLHACGVADPKTGGVIALVAKSGTGKTTASKLLGETYGYVTDETVAIQPDGVVRPYPKPLSIKNGGEFKEQVGPDQLELLGAPANPFIRGIALLNRQEEWRGGPLVEVLPLADAVLALIPETSSQGRIAQPLQSLCALLDSSGGLRRVTYSEASHLPAVLAEIFAQEPKSPGYDWSAGFPCVDESLDVAAGMFRRTNVQDAIATEGDLLLLSGEQITRISGIGPSIWAASSREVSREELMHAVTTEHGEPEGYELLVDAALTHLVEQGLVLQGKN